MANIPYNDPKKYLGGLNPLLNSDTTESTYGLKTVDEKTVKGIEGGSESDTPDVNPNSGAIPELGNLTKDDRSLINPFKNDGKPFETDITTESAVGAGFDLLSSLPGEIATHQQNFGELDSASAIRKANRARSLGTSIKAAGIATKLTANPLIGGMVGVGFEIGQRILGTANKDVQEMANRQRQETEDEWALAKNELENLYDNNNSETLKGLLDLKQQQQGILPTRNA